MSRCFPYPPPGYVRNPVAVAEAESTAKLQKEREKAEKKKEKRSDRKTLQQCETSKHSKHSHKKRKHEDISVAAQGAKVGSKQAVEQLEKSGLSEEHGAPCFIQTVHDSPESSQDSSKRRKVVMPSPSQAKNGNILRIKIQRDQDLPAGLLEEPRVLEQPSVKQMGSVSSLLGKQNANQHNRKVNVKSTAAAQQRISGDSQAVRKQVSTQLPVKVMRRDDPHPTSKVDPQLSMKAPVGRVDPQLSMKAPVGRVDPPSARVMGRVDTPPAKVLQRVDPQLPSQEIKRRCPPACANVMQKEASTSGIRQLEVASAIRQLEVPQPPLVQKPKEGLPIIKQQHQPISSAPNDEPCSSGRKGVPSLETKQSRSDQKKSRKVEKKEKKIRDLFVTWNPLTFDMEDSDLGGQDWLLGSTRNSDASMTSCRASDGSVPFQSMEQQPSLQPRATFLPDLHIYQLPYVVPF